MPIGTVVEKLTVPIGTIVTIHYKHAMTDMGLLLTISCVGVGVRVCVCVYGCAWVSECLGMCVCVYVCLSELVGGWV